MKVAIDLLDVKFIVEFDIEITAAGYPASGPTFSSGGEPGAGPEFDLEVLELRFENQHPDVELELPKWLSQLVAEHLYERDDVQDMAAEIDYERGQLDPDQEREESR